jgi:hypothetical protein
VRASVNMRVFRTPLLAVNKSVVAVPMTLQVGQIEGIKEDAVDK